MVAYDSVSGETDHENLLMYDGEASETILHVSNFSDNPVNEKEFARRKVLLFIKK